MEYISFINLLKRRGAIETRINNLYFHAVLSPDRESFYYSFVDKLTRVGTTEPLTQSVKKEPSKNSTLEYIINMYDGSS